MRGQLPALFESLTNWRGTQVISLMLVGMLVGWGFGAATMAAATRARSLVLLRSDYEIAQQTYVELHQDPNLVHV